MGYLTSPDPKIVFGALEALRVTIKRYEWVQFGWFIHS
jgi:hypothetical protein